MILAWLITAAHADAFVLEATSVRRLARAVKVARRLDPDRIVAQAPLRVCVELDDPEPRQVLRLARKLGHAPEARHNCDVAWFPLGGGWLAFLLEPPAEELEQALSVTTLPYHEIYRSIGGDHAVRLCTAKGGVSDPAAFAEDLTARGFPVRSFYEVGGCTRRAPGGPPRTGR